MNTAPYAKAMLGAHRVADDLWLLAGRPRLAFNVYVMGDVLVDAGTRHADRRILRQIRELPLRSHVITHAHLDHMGASHRVCQELGLPLLCGEADVAAAESGGRIGLADKPWPVRVAQRLLAGSGHPVDATLKQGDRVAGFSVLEVPGHSPGHLAFWRRRIACWCSGCGVQPADVHGSAGTPVTTAPADAGPADEPGLRSPARSTRPGGGLLRPRPAPARRGALQAVCRRCERRPRPKRPDHQVELLMTSGCCMVIQATRQREGGDRD